MRSCTTCAKGIAGKIGPRLTTGVVWPRCSFFSCAPRGEGSLKNGCGRRWQHFRVRPGLVRGHAERRSRRMPACVMLLDGPCCSGRKAGTTHGGKAVLVQDHDRGQAGAGIAIAVAPASSFEDPFTSASCTRSIPSRERSIVDKCAFVDLGKGVGWRIHLVNTVH